MRECKDNHEPIAYDSNDCPLCKLRLQMDQLIDDKEDIDQANIDVLFDMQKSLDKRMHVVEKRIGITPAKHSFLKHPIHYAQAVRAAMSAET